MRLWLVVLLLALLVAPLVASPGCSKPQKAAGPLPVASKAEISVANAEARRHAGEAELLTLATDADAAVQAQAVRALGRLGTQPATNRLIELGGAAGPHRPAALYGLAMASSQDARDMVARALQSDVLEERVAAAWALGRLGAADNLSALVGALRAPEPALREAAGLALGLYGRREMSLNSDAREALAEATEDADRDVRYGATYALAREHAAENGDAELSALTKAATDSDSEIRAVALFGLGKRAHDAELLYRNALEDADWRVRVQAVRAMTGTASTPSARDALASWVAGRWDAGEDLSGGGAHALLEASRALLPHADEEPVRALFERLHTEARSGPAGADPILTSALQCVAAAGRARRGGSLEDVFECGGEGTAWPLHERRALLAELIGAGLGGQVARRVELVRSMGADRDPRIRAAIIAAAMGSEDIETRNAGLELAEAAIRDDSEVVVVGSVADAIITKGVELSPALRDVLLARARKERDEPELVLTLLGALRAAEISEARDVFEAASQHANVTIRTAGLEALEALGGSSASGSSASRPAANESTTQPTTDATLAAPKLPPVKPESVMGFTVNWTLQTTRGPVVIELDASVAPWNVATLVQLAQRGFYSDILWHRVVPDFVVQGGDPGGSGWGGPGFTVVAEPSPQPYSRGAVGIADAGKDTGGSQIFIMHSRAPHLEGRYTLVGRVVSGMELVDALMVGDRIVSSAVVVK